MENTFKKILTTFLIVVVALGAAAGGWFAYKAVKSRAAITGPKMVVDPADKTLDVGGTVASKVVMKNISDKKVMSASFKLRYDSDAFKVTELDTAGSVFSLFPTKDTSNGVVTLAAGIGGGEPLNISEGLVATVKFKALKATSPTTDNITFLGIGTDTKINEYTDSGYKNILVGAEGAEYAVTGEVPKAGQGRLILSPATGKYKINETFNVKILVDTDEVKVSSAKAYINFNDDEFDISLDTKSSVFNNFLTKEVKNGVISLHAGTSNPFVDDNALFAILKVKGTTQPLTDSAYDLIFDKSKSAIYKYVVGAPENILSEVVNGSYEIGEGGGVTQAPLPPISLKGTAGNTVIKWEWQKNPNKENVAASEPTGYKIYVATESGKYYNPAAVSLKDAEKSKDVGNKLTYTSTGLKNGQIYYAIVKAYDKDGHLSAPSNEANATPYAQAGWGGPFEPDDPSTGGIFQMPSSLVATGLVIGGAVLVALVLTLVIWLVARRRKQAR